jgi:DNA-binding MarR family transcriptional regulator
LRKLARLASQRYDRALAPAGLNINQYSILRRAARGSRAIGDLARELGMDRSTLSRDIKPLIAAGWIERVDDEDGRKRRIAVTAAGKRKIDIAQPLWRKAQDAIDTGLGHDQVEELHGRLDRVVLLLERGTSP